MQISARHTGMTGESVPEIVQAEILDAGILAGADKSHGDVSRSDIGKEEALAFGTPGRHGDKDLVSKIVDERRPLFSILRLLELNGASLDVDIFPAHGGSSPLRAPSATARPAMKRAMAGKPSVLPVAPER